MSFEGSAVGHVPPTWAGILQGFAVRNMILLSASNEAKYVQVPGRAAYVLHVVCDVACLRSYSLSTAHLFLGFLRLSSASGPAEAAWWERPYQRPEMQYRGACWHLCLLWLCLHTWLISV